MLVFSVYLVTVVWTSVTYKVTACNSTLFNVGNTIYTLSDALVDANTASDECKLLGGRLAIVKDQTVKDKFYQEILQKYYQWDLQRVYIFYDYLNVESSPPQIVYKFSTSLSITGGWKSAKQLAGQQLWYLDMYNTNITAKERINFCRYHQERWRVLSIGAKGCPIEESWEDDFHLYARNSPAAGYQSIYNFWRNSHPHGSRLTDVDSFYDGFDISNGTFYLPARSVLVGARYNTTTKQWNWSDGTNANFSTTPTTCKQKAFSYGIKDLEDSTCSGQLAYYSCEVRPELTTWIKTENCNSTVIHVNWSNDIYTLATYTGSRYQIKTTLGNTTVTFTAAVFRYTFVGLKERTEYNIQFNASIIGCGSYNFFSSNKATTGYGKPDPVVDAYVKSPQPCVVALKKSPTDKNITTYKIIAASSKNVTVHTFQAADNFTIETSYHPSGETVNLTITASSCEGESPVKNITGYCLTPVVTTPVVNRQTTTGGNSSGSGTSIVGPLVGSLLGLLLLALIIFILFRRLKDVKKTGENLSNMNDNLNAVNMDDFGVSNQVGQEAIRDENELVYENLNVSTNHYKCKRMFETKSAFNGKIFRKEFLEIIRIDKGRPKSCQQATSDRNAQKNRYKNIFTYDHSRVYLGGSEENNYINASYIPGFKQEAKFIATQGPKPNTFADFWLMVWQQQSPVIVMLTKLKESGKKKCDRYWPKLGKEKAYGMVVVYLKQETDIGGIIRRKFTLKMGEGCLSVVHFQYTTWPDHGIPVTTSNMMHLRKMVEDVNDHSKPLIIHCSAGVGRTGTYIAIDTLFDQLDAKETIDVVAVVSRMREKRTDMVQTVEQYIFIHKLLVEHEMFPDFDRTPNDIQSMTEDDLHRIGSEEFHLLTEALLVEQQTYDSFRVSTWVEDDQTVRRLDAAFIQKLGCSTDFIASRQPNSESEHDFWKATVEQQVDVVICLQENLRDAIYSSDANHSVQLGSVNVRVISHNDGEEISHKILQVHINETLKMSREIHYLLVKNWKSRAAPSSAGHAIQAIEFLQGLQQNTAVKGRVLVCCSDGRARTGAFIALVNILERLKAHNKVDVFRTVKDLRDMRPNMVGSMDCYMFLYTAVLEYLSTFTTYANYK